MNYGAVDLTVVLGTDLRPKYRPSCVSFESKCAKEGDRFLENRKRVVPSRSLGGHMKVYKCLWREIPCATVTLLRTWDRLGFYVLSYIYMHLKFNRLWHLATNNHAKKLTRSFVKVCLVLTPPPQYFSMPLLCDITVLRWHGSILVIIFLAQPSSWIYVWWLICAILLFRFVGA